MVYPVLVILWVNVEGNWILFVKNLHFFLPPKSYTIVSTDHQVQFLIGFAIFHKPQHTQGLWKIAKKPNPIVKFGFGSVRKFGHFFPQKIELKFSKNREKYKKKGKKS